LILDPRPLILIAIKNPSWARNAPSPNLIGRNRRGSRSMIGHPDAIFSSLTGQTMIANGAALRVFASAIAFSAALFVASVAPLSAQSTAD